MGFKKTAYYLPCDFVTQNLDYYDILIFMIIFKKVRLIVVSDVPLRLFEWHSNKCWVQSMSNWALVAESDIHKVLDLIFQVSLCP